MAFASTSGTAVRLVLSFKDTRRAPFEVLETGLLLHIPLQRASEPRVVEITVFAPDGEREIVERHHLPAKRAWIESPLPASWLTPGEFRVVVAVENEAPSEHYFSIRAPAPQDSR